MNYGFFEELAEILAEQSAAKGREKVSEEFIDHIVKPASVEFADDQDLQNAVEQEAIDPISFYSLIANTEDTSSGSAEDKSQFMLERAREFFNVKSDVPEDHGAQYGTVPGDRACAGGWRGTALCGRSL